MITRKDMQRGVRIFYDDDQQKVVLEARRWTLSEIRDANMRAGRHFFDRATMRAFGDTMRSFAVRHIEGKVYVQRVRPMRDRDGRSMGGVGQLREFYPETGDIGVPIKSELGAEG
jgi:hypothetical protein